MKGYNTIEKLGWIADWMVEELRDSEDGEKTSTFELLKASNYDIDEFDSEDLMEIHNALVKGAKANHIKLDFLPNSKHKMLSYDLEYIINNKNAQYKCPFCGSTHTASILYGLPVFSASVQKKLIKGKLILGGCCMDGVIINEDFIQTDPKRMCWECKRRFGTAPINGAKAAMVRGAKDVAEDYRDIVNEIYFSVGNDFDGFAEVIITKNDKGALVSVRNSLDEKGYPVVTQISQKKYREILDTLYCKMFLHEWKKRYINKENPDGTHWTIDIKLTRGRKRTISGINEFPVYWNELLKIFRPYIKV